MTPSLSRLWLRAAATGSVVSAGLLLAACSGQTGPAPRTGLAPGLTADMAQPGAQLDSAAAFSILNQYRATRGVSAFSIDPQLSAQAQQLAQRYAQTGEPPAVPQGLQARYSAGYTNFADTFSGWRNMARDAQALSAGRRAGLAVSYNPDSRYGTHWVLLVGS